MKYLRAIKDFCNEGHVVIYTNNKCIHSSHTTPYVCTVDFQPGLLKAVSKEQCIIIVHTGYTTGYIKKNAALIFNSGAKISIMKI